MLLILLTHSVASSLELELGLQSEAYLSSIIRRELIIPTRLGTLGLIILDLVSHPEGRTVGVGLGA
jgi:hypothetical protein